MRLRMTSLQLAFLTVIYSDLSQAQFEETRCHCVCPSLKTSNNSQNDRVLYGGRYSHDDCNCDVVVLPQIGSLILDDKKLLSYCARCECRYESRNIRVIQIGVFLTAGLVVYLFFHLVCLKLLRVLRLQQIFGYKLQSDVITDDSVTISVIGFILAFSSLLIYLSFLSCTSRCGNTLDRKTVGGGGKYLRHLDDFDESDGISGADLFHLRPTAQNLHTEFKQRSLTNQNLRKFSNNSVPEGTDDS